MSVTNHFYGVGIYSILEAARLTGVAPRRIRRWIRGYSFRGATGQTRRSAPVFHSQLPVIDGQAALGFLDLIEVRFVDAFLKRGVQWPAIRLAEMNARQVF